MKPDTTKYAQRDIETQGQSYVDHVQAMTREGLHSKSDIAAELTHRDIQIAELTRKLAKCREALTHYAFHDCLSSEQQLVADKTLNETAP